MELHLKSSLVFAAVALLASSAASAVNWRCTCAAGLQGGRSSAPELNCSASCNCTFEGNAAWHCSCARSAPPEHTSDCFSSCDCSSSQDVKKSGKRKGILAALIVFAIISSAAGLLAFALRCLSSKDEFTSSSSSQSLGAFREFIRWLWAFFANSSGPMPGTAVVRFSYAELEQATNRFSRKNMIGVGGSCTVYRGELLDGRAVAVKKHRAHGGAEADCEFLSEIELLSRLNHCHVVQLLGFCSEQKGKNFERLLVFELMANGNLRDCLNMAGAVEKQALDWETRIKIALDAARGLEYLHEAAAPRILHRDIKSMNILLDDKLRAKITDLGMAKRLSDDDAPSCSGSPARMLGTFGYFAPECAVVGKASLKSDVFSFGVVILELITGRRPIVKTSSSYDESLVVWAAPRLCDSELVVAELPDTKLKGRFLKDEMLIMAHLARECTQWDPEMRPTMSEVVQILSAIAPEMRRRKLPASYAMELPLCAPRAADVERSSARLNPRSAMVIDRQDFPHSRLSIIENSATLADAERRTVEPREEMAVHLTEPRFENFTPAVGRRVAACPSFNDLVEPRLETFRPDDALE